MYQLNAIIVGNACMQHLFGALFGTFKGSFCELLGHILGAKAAPDRNFIRFPEIAALKAPLGLDLVGFWAPLGVHFWPRLANLGHEKPDVLQCKFGCFFYTVWVPFLDAFWAVFGPFSA